MELQPIEFAAQPGLVKALLAAYAGELGQRILFLAQRIAKGDLPDPAGDLSGAARQPVALFGQRAHHQNIIGVGIDDELAQRRIGGEATIPIGLAVDFDGVMEEGEAR